MGLLSRPWVVAAVCRLHSLLPPLGGLGFWGRAQTGQARERPECALMV